MEKIDFSSYDVQELNILEMKKTYGGIPWIIPFLIGVVAGGIVGELIRDGVKQCIKDFEAGYNSINEEN